jgi:hypothetical protein
LIPTETTGRHQYVFLDPSMAGGKKINCATADQNVSRNLAWPGGALEAVLVSVSRQRQEERQHNAYGMSISCVVVCLRVARLLCCYYLLADNSFPKK